MKILFISRNHRDYVDGGSIVTHRNYEFLSNLGDVCEITIERANLTTLMHNYILRESYGSTHKTDRLLKGYLKQNFDIVWFDGAIYGGYLKKALSLNAPIICFYHNIEFDFYKAKANASNLLLDRMIVPYIKLNERLSTSLSSKRVLLNSRDAERLDEIYGYRGDFILPTTFDSIPTDTLESAIDPRIEPYLLFVGSDFYANREGLDFFFKEVAPYINYKVKIVGSICEAFKGDSLPKNVTLEGRVNDLLPYYANSSAVISPILSGSGTKTKTIEALRFGKQIIGSEEALMGVDSKYYSQIGTLCKSPSDYINAIGHLSSNKLNIKSIEVFKKHYSTDEVFNQFKDFIYITLNRHPLG